MNLKELEEIAKRLEAVEQAYGTLGVIIGISAIVVLVLMWAFLKRSVEKAAELSSEKTLKQFQAELDKDKFRFQSKHQKQLDGIHNTYQSLQKLNRTIDFIMKGDKFYAPMKPQDEVKQIVALRHKFKTDYYRHKLLFPEQLCGKIEAILPQIDKFIETFSRGLFNMNEEEIKEQSDANEGGVYVAGVWAPNEFDDVLDKLSAISQEIESEFRKLYGTAG